MRKLNGETIHTDETDGGVTEARVLATPGAMPLVLLTDEEVGSMLGLSRTSMWVLRSKNQIAFYRVGTKILYSPDHIREYLARNERPVASPRRRRSA